MEILAFCIASFQSSCYFVFYGELNTLLVPLSSQKKLSFGPSFCIIKLNIIQFFWQKSGYSPFWILASTGQKIPKEVHKAIMRAINFVFWMELNTALKNLVFCISSFQSS